METELTAPLRSILCYMYGSSMDYVCGSGSDVPVEGMASRLMGLDLRPHLRVALG